MRKLGKTAILLVFIQSAWSQYPTELFVATDGSAPYSSIQNAIEDAKSFPDTTITIHIGKGIYREKVFVPAWNPNIHLSGEHQDSTIISWDDHFNKIDRSRNSTFYTATLEVQGENFRASNLTIENSAGDLGQAIALFAGADRCHFDHCRILGNQDALYVYGRYSRQLFTDCYIEGTTDYIFGNATAVFQNCRIHSLKNSFITAASTDKEKPFGLVFLQCQLTADPGIDSVLLGRPWRPFAKTVFIDCFMAEHIKPEGWQAWSQTGSEPDCFYAEYHNRGPGASVGKRVSWSRQLTDLEALDYKIAAIFASPHQVDFYFLKSKSIP